MAKDQTIGEWFEQALEDLLRDELQPEPAIEERVARAVDGDERVAIAFHLVATVCLAGLGVRDLASDRVGDLISESLTDDAIRAEGAPPALRGLLGGALAGMGCSDPRATIDRLLAS